MKQLIKKLVEAIGPSGFETQIRSLIMDEVSVNALESRVDKMGNLIIRIGNKSEIGKRIMIVGHMDEIGVMVTHIDDNGFIRFTNIGGLILDTLTGNRVKFTNGTLGVIGVEYQQDFMTLPQLEKFYIDVGASNRGDCPVGIGDAAGFWRTYEDLGNRLVSKTMDDRIAVSIMIQAIKEIEQTPHELFFVFTTQEEVGCRGATTAAYEINPDIGIAIDITSAWDTPNSQKYPVALGAGPAIKVKDASVIVDPRIVDWMQKAATENQIPHQFEVMTHGGTDTGVMSITRAGVPSGCISVPTRYGHTPSEMVDYEDVINCVILLTELVSKPVELG